jgi:RNA-directed DNA polymerase
MKEPYRQGIANQSGPKSGVDTGNGGREAWTGVRAGRVIELRDTRFGRPTPFSGAEGNTRTGNTREPVNAPAESETPGMPGNPMRENREAPAVSVPNGGRDRSGNAAMQTPDANAAGESDCCVVPTKQSNQGPRYGPAEVAEGRRRAKENAGGSDTCRTQGRESVSPGLTRVREAAKQSKEARFTALLHHVDEALLRDSYFALKREAAAGVDGVTWKEYGQGLEARIRELHDRVHRGSYRAKPSRRTYIPKPDGRQRPLGIASLEDKIVQQAVRTVLEQIYEQDFVGFSYGFRPGRGAHEALDALTVGIERKKVNWVLDADIQGFFDAIDHERLLQLVERRVADPRIDRLLRKWLQAGVSEDGKRSETKVGTPQGAVISPLLANVYLHYVMDQWAAEWRRRQARGDMIMVRYADDVVFGFERREDAERFWRELQARFAEYGLTLHPTKTRLIEFGRFAELNRRERGKGKPETFEFLGFRHRCGRTWKGNRFQVQRTTVKKRLRAKLQQVRDQIDSQKHRSLAEVGQWLGRVSPGLKRPQFPRF